MWLVETMRFFLLHENGLKIVHLGWGREREFLTDLIINVLFQILDFGRKSCELTKGTEPLGTHAET